MFYLCLYYALMLTISMFVAVYCKLPIIVTYLFINTLLVATCTHFGNKERAEGGMVYVFVVIGPALTTIPLMFAIIYLAFNGAFGNIEFTQPIAEFFKRYVLR